MNEPWYESQIAGVAIGAILGFLLSYIPKKLDEIGLRSKLKKALKADIRSIVKSTKHALTVVNEAIEALNKVKPCAIYAANTKSSKVYETNLSNISILDEELIEEIINFYALVEKTKSRLAANAEVLEKYNTESVKVIDRNYVIQGCTSLKHMYEQIITDGQKIIEKLKDT